MTYDIRGIVSEDIDEEVFYRIARAFAVRLKAKKVVVGYDARETSPIFSNSVVRGLLCQGVDVLTLGLCGTEEVYWATNHFGACGGIEITASHNPINYNGMKLVKEQAKPLDPETDLKMIKEIAETNKYQDIAPKGKILDVKNIFRASYVDKLLEFIDISLLKRKKILVNCGNGAAGPTFDAIEKKILGLGTEMEFIKIHHSPDSSFPNGIPNPLLKKNQAVTSNAVVNSGADFGVAFDGDFDRCFFFDEKGKFIPSQYMVGIIAEKFLLEEKGSNIVHDGRLVWNTQDIVKRNGGTPVVSKTGHAFIKMKMRETNAVYGGEISAHHYFRDFSFCDSGMLPWIIFIELLSLSNKTFSAMVEKFEIAYPSSEELNFKLNDPGSVLLSVKKHYKDSCLDVCELDGLSISFANWRLNLRKSNTESFVRLNIETKGDKQLLTQKIAEVRSILQELDSN